MASFSRSFVSLPSYLKKWPELHTDKEIDLFCTVSKSAETSISLNERRAYSEMAKERVFRDGALEFHRELKLRLARGY